MYISVYKTLRCPKRKEVIFGYIFTDQSDHIQEFTYAMIITIGLKIRQTSK